MFELAASVELFQEKLSRQTIRLLRGVTFEARSASEILDVLFRAATTPTDTKTLWLGPAASKLLLDRQTDHIQSAKGFIFGLKVGHADHLISSLLIGKVHVHDTFLREPSNMHAY